MTPFGELLRKERKERGLTLDDMAEGLGMSSPYLSQMETGAKPLKEAFVEKVLTWLDLDHRDAAVMRRAAAISVPASLDSVTIDLRHKSSEQDRELAFYLALRFNHLDQPTKTRLRELLAETPEE